VCRSEKRGAGDQGAGKTSLKYPLSRSQTSSEKLAAGRGEKAESSPQIREKRASKNWTAPPPCDRAMQKKGERRHLNKEKGNQTSTYSQTKKKERNQTDPPKPSKGGKLQRNPKSGRKKQKKTDTKSRLSKTKGKRGGLAGKKVVFSADSAGKKGFDGENYHW